MSCRFAATAAPTIYVFVRQIVRFGCVHPKVRISRSAAPQGLCTNDASPLSDFAGFDVIPLVFGVAHGEGLLRQYPLLRDGAEKLLLADAL